MDDDHLPVYGVGPYLIIPMLAITLLFSFAIKIPVFKVDYLNAPFLIIGVIFLVLGVIFWILSVVRSKITENILESNLITTGIYAYVRHPIYSAFLFVSTGRFLFQIIYTCLFYR
ncbi:isoprenylcysteine carboxylmethyltransferase family protein [uncultured Methanobrevibacter sp.]|uniref:isoprenylcysteine carboxylmethyltransferase family protein n=1 Tax=uncultured Methanobrevibacter sp. TaxID=253161 RepID=UPI0025EBF657|nr:isoprenylcysteine carboxylmethyltransferase family protein [uncultured Methanobrevibacter sp.]